SSCAAPCRATRAAASTTTSTIPAPSPAIAAGTRCCAAAPASCLESRAAWTYHRAPGLHPERREVVNEAEAFWVKIEALRGSNDRYAREAYAFVLSSLGFAAERLPDARRRDPARRHLSGQELLAALLEHARNEFGYLARSVLTAWGVRDGRDVGTIVFQLVDAQLLSRRPEDRLEDFGHGPDVRVVPEEVSPWSALPRTPRAAVARARALKPQPPTPES